MRVPERTRRLCSCSVFADVACQKHIDNEKYQIWGTKNRIERRYFCIAATFDCSNTTFLREKFVTARRGFYLWASSFRPLIPGGTVCSMNYNRYTCSQFPMIIPADPTGDQSSCLAIKASCISSRFSESYNKQPGYFSCGCFAIYTRSPENPELPFFSS